MSRGWTPPIIACALAALVWTPVTPVRPVTPVTIAPAAAPSDSMRSTQSGVYTDEQAALGKDVFALQCLSCHGGDLAGPPFRTHWAGKLLSNLYGLMVETMPKDNAGTLSVEEYVQAIAYLLKANGMPAGNTPLPADSLALTKVRLDTVLTKQ